jgi:hypothetical protein
VELGAQSVKYCKNPRPERSFGTAGHLLAIGVLTSVNSVALADSGPVDGAESTFFETSSVSHSTGRFFTIFTTRALI